MCGKYFKRKHRIAKHMQIKHKHILVPGQRYQDSRHLLHNPKGSKSVMGFNNHAQRSTPPYNLDVDNPFEIKTKQKIYILQKPIIIKMPSILTMFTQLFCCLVL